MKALPELALARLACPRSNTDDVPSLPTVQRAKSLQLDLSRQLRLVRENAGITQQQLADAVSMSRTSIERWESSEARDVPSLRHLVIAPRDYALPLLRWAVEQHERELRAVDVATIEAEARIACLDLLRAFEVTDQFRRAQLIERATHRVANASRAVLAVTGGR